MVNKDFYCRATLCI